jgi:hypothetical protein
MKSSCMYFKCIRDVTKGCIIQPLDKNFNNVDKPVGVYKVQVD